MTPELIELSKQAAEVLGIPQTIYDHNKTRNLVVWLAEDSGRCAEIAADKRIGTIYYQNDFVIATWIDIDGDYRKTTVFLADHNNNRLKTWRVAVLKAVIEQGKQ